MAYRSPEPFFHNTRSLPTDGRTDTQTEQGQNRPLTLYLTERHGLQTVHARQS